LGHCFVGPLERNQEVRLEGLPVPLRPGDSPQGVMSERLRAVHFKGFGRRRSCLRRGFAGWHVAVLAPREPDQGDSRMSGRVIGVSLQRQLEVLERQVEISLSLFSAWKRPLRYASYASGFTGRTATGRASSGGRSIRLSAPATDRATSLCSARIPARSRSKLSAHRCV